MKRRGTFVVLLCASAVATVAWAGHEMPVYPSFYPHQIDIQKMSPDQAPATLVDGELHAYVGRGVRFSSPPPESIGKVESLGTFVVVRVNPRAPPAQDETSMCTAVRSVVREVARGDVVLNPYPVTPLHGDYIYHVDLAEAAKAQITGAPSDPPIGDLKIKASGIVAQSHPNWSAIGTDWQIEVSEVDASDLVVASTYAYAMGGWMAPPWVKNGWFQAEQLLADAVTDPAAKQRADADAQRLMKGDFSDLAARVNLERDLVKALTSGCHEVVAGYTLKREYFNADFTAGIENIGYDSIMGLQSPIFLRTAKLKDFPWNGWLKLGVDAAPTAAWNPVGGMTDPFSRLMWSAVSDPALLPSPYDAGWMLNRIADLPIDTGQ